MPQTVGELVSRPAPSFLIQSSGGGKDDDGELDSDDDEEDSDDSDEADGGSGVEPAQEAKLESEG